MGRTFLISAGSSCLSSWPRALPTASRRAADTVTPDRAGTTTTRAAVRVAIEEMLDTGLPEKYTVDLFEQKCGALFQHMLEKYPQRDGTVYKTEVA